MVPTALRARWAVRRSDDLEGLVSRMAMQASSRHPHRRWTSPRGTDLATATALRLLGEHPTDTVTRALTIYLVACRERWPATFVSAAAVLAGHVRENAWVEIDGRAFGVVAPMGELDHRELFRQHNYATHRLPPLAAPLAG